jgi:hypothetical protein
MAVGKVEEATIRLQYSVSIPAVTMETFLKEFPTLSDR